MLKHKQTTLLVGIVVALGLWTTLLLSSSSDVTKVYASSSHIGMLQMVMKQEDRLV
jgi:hypothetical protein